MVSNMVIFKLLEIKQSNPTFQNNLSGAWIPKVPLQFSQMLPRVLPFLTSRSIDVKYVQRIQSIAENRS
ncbi:hypothetical protein NQ317_012771 [Molorchus minor]|uniref:Uncharacterized protein n=1 Tax=Molorchus minor TaxID=1323400 RepID=A0ABQ9K3D8_9CUCU|nr:hypothetical protein NQ317_012771 [Molorchus minor]